MNNGNALLSSVLAKQFSHYGLYQLRVQAERALLISGFDELLCLNELGFEPFEYQLRAAEMLLRRFRGRGMFCDEVGLGKTIEAGLVIKEYMVRKAVQRVLVLTPAPLVEQWREELAYKFGLPNFTSSADADFRYAGTTAWQKFPFVIASLATARRADHRPALAEVPFDLIVVDEAHHLKNRNSASWKLVNDLQRRYIVLLTATPVENNLDELYNLITLIKPGQLSTPKEFRKQFVLKGDPRLPNNRGQLRDLLGDVMVRNTRSRVNLKLPPRQANTIKLALSPAERQFYDQVSAFVRDCMAESLHLANSETAESPSPEPALRQVDRFALLALQREIGSSAATVETTLINLADRPSMAGARRRRLLQLAQQALEIDEWAKADALEKLLVTLLRDPNEKVLIFTQFRRTLARLTARLQNLEISFVTYHGELDMPSKNQAIRQFEQHARVLLSTEAAGEGRNLQFCRTMINFDIPWNPMRIEQRVGRIHRVGQTREVRIFNLSAEGTVEDYLLDILDQKLNMFELVIGEMDMILGQLSDERDFEDLLFDIWVKGNTNENLQSEFLQFGETLAQARQQHQKAQAYDDALFGEDFVAE